MFCFSQVYLQLRVLNIIEKNRIYVGPYTTIIRKMYYKKHFPCQYSYFVSSILSIQFRAFSSMIVAKNAEFKTQETHSRIRQKFKLL